MSIHINPDGMPWNSLELSFTFTIYKVQHKYLSRVNHHNHNSQEEKSGMGGWVAEWQKREKRGEGKNKPYGHKQLTGR
jgi:hypothetical protein